MSAALERAELAAIGRDLAGLIGDGGYRRGRALLGEQQPETAASFADLALAPEWLRRSQPDLLELAQAAALIAMGPAIAASIDGGWLRELVARGGDLAMDRAIAKAQRVPDGGLPPLPAEMVEALGFDLMRAALPPALHRYLSWAPGGGVPVTRELATFCLAEAARV